VRVAAQGSGDFHRYVPSGINLIFLLGNPVNFGSHAFYRHGDRDILPTDIAVTPLIKTLREG
jgi:hypothetical protein